MTDDRVIRLAEDLFRLVVNSNGGIPGQPGEVAREVVRQARAFYSEVDRPTQAPKKAAKPAEDEPDMGAEFE